MTVLLVALGGLVGAVVRVAADSALTERYARRWPLGTFTVNVLGSLLLGVLTGLVLRHGLPEQVHTALGTGFCGGLTTFSTATLETVALAGQGRRLAAGYALGGLVTTLLAATAGLAVSGGWSA